MAWTRRTAPDPCRPHASVRRRSLARSAVHTRPPGVPGAQSHPVARTSDDGGEARHPALGIPEFFTWSARPHPSVRVRLHSPSSVHTRPRGRWRTSFPSVGVMGPRHGATRHSRLELDLQRSTRVHATGPDRARDSAMASVGWVLWGQMGTSAVGRAEPGNCDCALYLCTCPHPSTPPGWSPWP